MTGRAFLDTNILVYAVDNADPVKQKRAREIVADISNVVISAQVLNEFFNAVTRKLAEPVPRLQATAMVMELARLPCVPVDADLVRAALDAGQHWQLSHWDALIVEAARQAGCSVVLTEDLATGANYGGVVVENPFT